MKIRQNLSLLILILAVILVAGFIFVNNKNDNNAVIEQAEAGPKDREQIVNIESGMTFSTVTEQAGIDKNLMVELLAAAEPVYDLAKIKVGKPIRFIFAHDTDALKEVIYQIDTETELFITKTPASPNPPIGGEGEDSQNELGETEDSWTAAIKDIEYEIKIKTVEGSIETSLYESALAQNIDERAIIELADVFAWTIDFAMGIRVGDTYKFIFEERYRNGEYVMPGKIMAAKFVNDGKVVEGYYYEYPVGEEIEEGYYHPDGQSVMKMFLKNPVNYKYITSGYTTGLRYVEAFNVSTGHRAIDYAAAIGTPIRAVGDGTVVSAGWNRSGYGNLTSIRHNSVYTTNYAHQSKIYVKVGQKVSQGDIIGAVGSTGFSTGPHLHFEMVKNGTKINPLTVELPADKAVPEEKLEDFKNSIKSWQEQLNG